MRILALVVALLLPGGAVADNASSPEPERVQPAAAAAAFSHLERQLIVEYYESRRQRARRSLPPGIARKLARGDSLPAGIAGSRLPGELENRLPLPPRGYQRVVVDGRVVLVEIASRVVHDVLTDIVVAR